MNSTVNIINDFNKFCWVYPLLLTFYFRNTFIQFNAYIENLVTLKIKTIRTYGGGEFVNNSLQEIILDTGTNDEIIIHHSPEKNGVLKSKHKHLLEITRTFLTQSFLYFEFLFHEFSTANYVINRLPTRYLYPLILHINISSTNNLTTSF